MLILYRESKYQSDKDQRIYYISFQLDKDRNVIIISYYIKSKYK